MVRGHLRGGRDMKKRTESSERKLGNPALLLRLPENVGAKLAKDAKKAKTTTQAVVLGILADHYGIEVAAPRRGQPKKLAALGIDPEGESE